MNARLIQEQVRLESQVKFILQGGGDISGKLVEIGREHCKIEVEENQSPATIPIDRVVYWQLLKDTSNNRQNRAVSVDDRPDKSLEVLPADKAPVKKEPETDRSKGREASASLDIEVKIEKELVEIETRFRVKSQSAKVEIKEPNFKFVEKEFSGSEKEDAVKIWNRVRDKYQNAKKINELSSIFGRIQPIVVELKNLAERFPNSTSIKRHIAYLCLLSGSRQDALKFYREVAVYSRHEDDWCNLAAIAQETENDALACYSLGQVFQQLPVTRNIEAWYLYIYLLIKFDGYKELDLLCQSEVKFLSETAIYLLKMGKQEAMAREILRKSITGDISISSIQKNLNTLGQEPTEEYKKIAEEIEDMMKGSHYENRPTQNNNSNLVKKPIQDWYKLAENAASTGEYSVAISHIKKVLFIDKDYLNAKKNYEKWRGYERLKGVPKGSNPFAVAKRAQLLDHNLDKADHYFRQAIKQNDNLESAVKDLAALLAQRERFKDAVRVIEQNRFQIDNEQSLENLLVNFYPKAGEHDKALILLQKQFKQTQNLEKRDQIRWQMANFYRKKEEYVKAEKLLREILKRQPDHISAKRNLALCLSEQRQYDEAKDLLNQILDIFPTDERSNELLDAILQIEQNRDKENGDKEYLNEIVIETDLSDYSSGQTSAFTQFFLDRCDFTGVPPDRVQSKQFRQSDIDYLERRANQARASRPSERASYFLSAAKIISIIYDEDPNRFYRDLYKSFVSKGNDIVHNNGNIDAAREWYAEALSISIRHEKGHLGDLDNALVRFLYLQLGLSHIPIPPQNIPSIDDIMREVIRLASFQRSFDDITYLVFRSKYAAKRLLPCLYNQQDLRKRALQYLKGKGIHTPEPSSQKNFIRLWDQLIDRLASDIRELYSNLRHFSNFQLTTAWLEDAIEQCKGVIYRLRFDLDRQRIQHLKDILGRSIEMCKQDRFEARERLCHQIKNSCRDLLEDTKKNPTRISVEVLYSVIKNIQIKAGEYLEELYETSKPELTLDMPVEYYSGHEVEIDVDIVVKNKSGCSPAEGLELIVKKDDESFFLNQSKIKLEESLLGGSSHTFIVPLQLTDRVLQSKAFSLSVYARYSISAEVIEKTTTVNFAIRLYSASEFEEIINPYNEGPPVIDPEMFYGRDRMIENIANSIQEPHTQNKCVLIYGQKRAGKSSIMYHLKKALEIQNLIILNLGNIGQFLDESSHVPFSYQIFWQILSSLKEAIEDRMDDGFSPLDMPFPSMNFFYEHPTPMVLFKEVFNTYQRLVSKQMDWRDVQLVLFIDEFSYIYGQILVGKIPESFMKNWKALMQANYFSAVLVGQDIMERFIEDFQNEFGIARKERVSYLDQEDAEKLIIEPVLIGGQGGESRYREPRAIERILELTAGSPFYVQMFCNRLVEHMNRKQAIYITYSYVEQIKNELMNGRNSLGLSNFENLYNSGEDNKSKDEDMLKILRSIALHSQTGPCNRSHIDCETELPVDNLLYELVERGVIDQKGDYYTIKVGLFKEWLLIHKSG